MREEEREPYDELEHRRRARLNRKKRLRRQRRRRRFGFVAMSFVLAVGIMALTWRLASFIINRDAVDLSAVETPDWVKQDFLDVNPYSRPGVSLPAIRGVVVHYVANKGTSAQNNWNYFNNLAITKERYASSHFIIGLDGEILQGVPLDEIANAVKGRNMDTVSIECCHPDETGKFNDATYASLVKLTVWLCDTFHLDETDVIRHYDATGKDCPKYYVAHEDAWEEFRGDVKTALKELKKQKKRP